MKIEECTALLEKRFRVDIQEKWDNCGVQILHAAERLSGVLCALDCSASVISEAIELQCNLIVTHHPLIFPNLRSISTRNEKGIRIVTLVDKRISVISLHTCLDRLYWHQAAVVLGVPFEGPVFAQGGSAEGYGVLLKFEQGIPLDGLIRLVKERLHADSVRITRGRDTIVYKAVFLPGSGGSYIDTIIAEKSADCIITGDVSYHRFSDAQAEGISLIDAGHFYTEKNYLAFLREDIYECISAIVPEIQILCSKSEQTPFRCE